MFVLDKIKNYINETKQNNKKRWKNIVLAAPFWVIIVSLVLIISFIVRLNILYNSCQDQFAAEHWSNGNSDRSYGQVTVFGRGLRVKGDKAPAIYIDKKQSLSLADVNTMRSNLQGVVDSFAQGANSKQSGLNTDGSPRGWVDAYSSTLMADISAKRDESTFDSSVECEVVAVGGDYKVFHPMQYMDGGFLPTTAVDSNQIVINDVLAWYLYKSYDVLGEQLIMFGDVFTVSGVVRIADNGVVSKTNINNPRVYIYFSTLDKYNAADWFGTYSEGSAPMGTTSNLSVLSYEVMLPESVSGVATTDLIGALEEYSATDPQLRIVRNTGRFSFLRLYDYMIPIGDSSRVDSKYDLPFWESAALITCEYMFIDWCLIFIGIVGLLIGILMISLKVAKLKQKNT